MAKLSRLGQVLSALRIEEGFLEAQLGKVRDAIGALGGVGRNTKGSGARGRSDRCAECEEDDGAAEGGEREDEEVLGGTEEGSLIRIGESNGRGAS
jgi:hypothetical protein